MQEVQQQRGVWFGDHLYVVLIKSGYVWVVDSTFHTLDEANSYAAAEKERHSWQQIDCVPPNKAFVGTIVGNAPEALDYETPNHRFF